MKKQDYIIVGILLCLMLAWPYVYQHFFAPPPAPPPPAGMEQPASLPAQIDPKTPTGPTGPAGPARPATVREHETHPPAPRQPEQRQKLTGPEMTVTLSSHGAGMVAAELRHYRQQVAPDSPPVIMDFEDAPALTCMGLPGFEATDDFTVHPGAKPESLVFERVNHDGLRLTRTITLQTDYQLEVRDVLTNTGDQPLPVPEYEVRTGYMRGLTGDPRESEFLGVDALHGIGGEGVVYWAKKIPKEFREAARRTERAHMPVSLSLYNDRPVDWVAAKNKFFVQLLTPASGTSTTAYRVMALRETAPGEQENPALAPRKARVTGVAAAASFPETVLQPGDSIERRLQYYAGPKKFSILRRIGMKQEEVMEFGMWSPVSKLLLTVLNATYRVMPNYGIAIILLTILIRTIFWPLTHKSTQSMRKMQTLQPLMTEIRNKYKDNPKKMQAEIMGLYREHKVNPMGGCLPMVIQIPVFIALFVVLRSAIELRFASFLWIADLSEPERLLDGILPIPLNILPIIMAVTMVWQQKLMPAGADSGQQRMMMVFMPVMMLVMFYMMPAALVLYWTTNQCIMIAQQLIQKKLGQGLLQFIAKKAPPA